MPHYLTAELNKLVETLVLEVLFVHREVYLGLVVPVVLAAVEGMVDLSKPVL